MKKIEETMDLGQQEFKINSIMVDSTKSKTDLCELGTKYPTDKSPYNTLNPVTKHGSGHRHPYTAVYDLLFSTIRYKEIKIAELGVLDNMSMLCWREYFPNANLFGFDFNSNFIRQGQNLNLEKTVYDFMDVKNVESIESGLSKYGKYDIIIEDTTHEFDDQIRVCGVAHKYLNPGGVLVIEDIFRNIDENKYKNYLSDIMKYYSTVTFIVTEHNLKYSPNWDNDKLLILVRNEYN
jgi:predicted O-methyltransferase YrrM